MNEMSSAGILLVNKPAGKTSFQLVGALRKILGVKKIGHAGTLDPFATGVMVMLIGREYTKLSDSLLTANKEYITTVRLGASTDTYDLEGEITEESPIVPTLAEIEAAVALFQGEMEQIPPMYSAKKINGQKLCDLARKGKIVERKPCKVWLETAILEYHYPLLKLKIRCSKGTYIRSLAFDIGQKLKCFGHLINLQRTASGQFLLDECIDGQELFNAEHLTIKTKIQTSFKKDLL